MQLKNSICNKCNSKNYCQNAAIGMIACINFNKFPKENETNEKGGHHGLRK